MIVKVRLAALKDTQWYEYALRFGLGGLATVATGLIAKQFGPVVGGLFLAFPAIFSASASLVEKHERRRKQKLGLRGVRRGQQAAALDSAGAALGSFGLAIFAILVWKCLPAAGAIIAFPAATAAWLVVSICLWWGRRDIRVRRRSTGKTDRKARRAEDLRDCLVSAPSQAGRRPISSATPALGAQKRE